MKLSTDPGPWAAYEGTWYFTLYMDYRLTLRLCRGGISLLLRDLTRGEACELIPIRACDEQLVFRMKSSWLNARLRLYPRAGGGGLIVEWTDVDTYTPAAPLEVPRGKAIRVSPAEPLPEWVYGTWTALNGDAYLLLEPAEDGSFRLAKWWDAGMKPPTKQRSYSFISDITWADAFGLGLVWKTCRPLDSRVEGTLFFDAAHRQLLLQYTRREPVLRELPELSYE